MTNNLINQKNTLMELYIKNNDQLITSMIWSMLDTPNDMDYKIVVFRPYMNFLYKLEAISKYGYIDNNSPLKPQAEFIDKLIDITERYKRVGDDLPSIINQNKFKKWFLEMVSDWIKNDLEQDLAIAEKDFYSRIAWMDEPLETKEKKHTPLQKKKDEAMSALKKYKNQENTF